MNFIIEYHTRIIKFSFSKENKLNLSDENALLYAKYIHKIIFQKLIFDIRF